MPDPDANTGVFESWLEEALQPLGVVLEPAQRQRMQAHVAAVIEANQRFNLTRITDWADAAVKHVADSLTLLATPWVDTKREGLRLLDVGTGAGFPAVPLAIARPHWHVTAIDGTGKKIRFVAEAAADLANLQARHARAADLAREGKASYDVITFRAVGKMAPSMREVHTLLAPGGLAVFYKTANTPDDELDAANRAAAALGLSPLEPFPVDIPAPDGLIHRQLIAWRTCSAD